LCVDFLRFYEANKSKQRQIHWNKILNKQIRRALDRSDEESSSYEGMNDEKILF
jgi:hypothetical protein